MYFEPILRNDKGYGALTFDNFPIESPNVGDTGKVSSVELTAGVSSVEQFDVSVLKAAVKYEGGFTDTNNCVHFVSLDTFVCSVNEAGMVTAVNTGTAKIVAMKQGLSDTITLTVVSSQATLKGVKFVNRFGEYLVGDAFAPALSATFEKGGKTFRAIVDTLATWTYDAQKLQITKGSAKGLTGGAAVKLVGSLGAFKDTLTLNIYKKPSFIKRINFQGTGETVTKIEGWEIDSLTMYSPSLGYGFTGTVVPTPGTFYEGNALVRTYIRPRWNVTSMTFKIDAPDGDYIIRTCTGVSSIYPTVITYKGDTINYNAAPASEQYNSLYFQLNYVDRKIKITGGNGCEIVHSNPNTSGFGKFCYMVLISDNGTPMNLVANDVNPVIIPKGTPVSGELLPAESFASDIDIYPNPFNPVTHINISKGITKDKNFIAKIYDARGRVVMDLSDEFMKNSGRINWDAAKLPSGIYALRIMSAKFNKSKKLVLVR
ncbi:MAG: T9SS type A sorting domain-containing protein [Fibrobacteres bacterium]|nr:T9SS type A sorting domain-containing protein [Fibrobacterota bacterium]